MYEIIKNILCDRATDTFSFKPFSICHILYMLIITTSIVLVILAYKDKDKATKGKVVNNTVNIAFGLYMADFFIMPLSTGQISIEKLPFHICTLMSILCFISRHNNKLSKFKNSFTLLGMIGALMYISFPTGVCNWEGKYFDGYSYRIIQTVIYHGLMVAQGVFAIAFGDVELNWSNFKYDVYTVLGMTVWALIGNEAYTDTIYEACNCVEGCNEMIAVYEVDPNWFFVKHDPLYILPDETDSYYSPFIMIAAMTGMCALIRFLSDKLLKIFYKNKSVY